MSKNPKFGPGIQLLQEQYTHIFHANKKVTAIIYPNDSHISSQNRLLNTVYLQSMKMSFQSVILSHYIIICCRIPEIGQSNLLTKRSTK